MFRAGIVGLTLLLSARYTWWRLHHAPGWGDAPLAFLIFSYALLGIEVLLTPGTRPLFVKTIDRVAQASAQLRWYGEHPPRVDVLIPTYNEPWAVLEKTLAGATNQRYPNYHVWLLDDGRREWLRNRAEAAKVGYITRDTNANYKAGNINHALAELRAQGVELEHVALLDADFIPRPEFVLRTVALMKDDRVGIVQTPQYYYNPDPFQRIFGIHAWPEEQRSWFDFIQPAQDARGHANCCGTSCLIRVAALDAIGGMPTESISEDVLCSMKLREQGYRTVYLSQPLTVGLAAESIEEWYLQRSRWLSGEIQCIRALGPAPGTLGYIAYWLSLLRLPICALEKLLWTLAYLLYWYTGYWVLKTTVAEAAWYFLPMWSMAGLWSFASRGTFNGVVIAVYTAAQRFFWFQVPARALAGKASTFRVTGKSLIRERSVIHWHILRWHALIAAALAVGVVYNLVLPGAPAHEHPFRDAVALLSLALLVQIACALAPTIEMPQRRLAERYQSLEVVSLSSRAGRRQAKLRNISLGGLLLEASGLEVGEIVSVEMDSVGTVEAEVVRREDAGLVALRFVGEFERAALIQKLYCSNDYVPLPASWSLFGSLLGLVHLAVRALAPQRRRA